MTPKKLDAYWSSGLSPVMGLACETSHNSVSEYALIMIKTDTLIEQSTHSKFNLWGMPPRLLTLHSRIFLNKAK